MAGQPVTVICARTPGAEGWAQGTRITLDTSTCRALLLRNARGPDNIDAAEATAALAHEIGHVVVGGCERAAEHYAMTHWQRLYRALGFGTADSIARVYVLSMHDSLPREYRMRC
jgi:hypothetical protein